MFNENAEFPSRPGYPSPIINKNDNSSEIGVLLANANWTYCFLYLIPLGTICGNVFVCLAVFIERRLRNGFNLFLVSLSVSDMLCAILVMPFSATKFVFNIDTSREVCLVWYSLDVFFTSTTIIHLCTISLDRYLVLRKPLQYGPRRDAVDYTFCGKISIAWLISFFIAGPLFIIALFMDDGRNLSVTEGDETNKSYKGCGPNDTAFVLTAVAISFILPLIIMITTYLLTVNTLRRKMNQARSAQLYVSNGSTILNPSRDTMSTPKTKQLLSSIKSSICDVKRSSKETQDTSNSTVLVNRVASIDESMLRESAEYDQGKMTTAPPTIVLTSSEVDQNDARNNKKSFHSVVNRVKMINRQEKMTKPQCGNNIGMRKFEIWRIVKDYREFLEREDQRLETEWAMASIDDEDASSSPIMYRHKKLSNEREFESRNTTPTHFSNEISPIKTDNSKKSSKKNSLVTILSTTKLSGESFRERVRYFRNLSNKDQTAQKRTIERIHKGHRAMQVIGVLFAVFFTCYTPFFALYLTASFCKSCEWTGEWITRIEWLGYLGSMLNPFVYHFFNPAFRRTFRRMFKFDYTRSSKKGDSSSKSIKMINVPRVTV